VDALEAIGDPIRREMLRLVWNEERTAGDVASHFDVSFSAISQHFAVLREAGVVDRRREGRRQFYRANHDALGPFAGALEAFWSDSLQRLRVLAEAETRALKPPQSEHVQ